MKYMCMVLIMLIFGSSVASAGVYVCKDAGTNRVLKADVSYSGPVEDGCFLWTDQNANIQDVDALAGMIKQLKRLVMTGSTILSAREMTQQEKDEEDAEKVADQQSESDAAFNAVVDQAIAEVDAPTSVSSLLNTCISAITTDDIRKIKGGNPNTSKTDEELKQIVKSCLTSFKK